MEMKMATPQDRHVRHATGTTRSARPHQPLHLLLLPVILMLVLQVLLLPLLPGAQAADVGTFDTAHCTTCSGMRYCSALNGKLLVDPVVGYSRAATSQLEAQGACQDLDAKTLALSRFGDRDQFKDTPLCHQLVWNYHCLSWVAAAVDQVTAAGVTACSSSSSSNSVRATLPLPPCRSLCVEVADKCVFAHFYRAFLDNVCGNVACVSEAEQNATNGALTQRACVPGAWETVPNTTVSRCSTRVYEPPTTGARRLHGSGPTRLALALAIGLASVSV